MKPLYKNFIALLRNVRAIKAASLLLIFFLPGSVDSISQNVFSLHPLFTEKNAEILPHLEGEWYSKDFDLVVSILKTGDNFYWFKYGEGNDEAKYEAVVIKIREEYFLDLCGILPVSVSDADFRNSFIQSHTFFKLTAERNEIVLRGLTNSWFSRRIEDESTPIEVNHVGNKVLLSSGTSQLQSFFAEFGHDPGLFDGGLTFVKTVPSEMEIPRQAKMHKGEYIIPAMGRCLPSFPVKEGWLGADGDVSVPISSTSSLFIFSDTYVGNAEQGNRAEAPFKMISNSVGITTCLPNGETEVHYYWNDMYSGFDEPIFKSFTDRYRFWVVDAFMSREALYVILEKIGPKVGAAEDDIFDFTLMGYTLAKVTNPFDLPPDWKIELSSMTDFDSQNFSLRNHAIKGDSIYFFVGNNDKSMGLVRKHINQVENFAVPLTYYSTQKFWRKGENMEDLETIIEGFRSNTVNYHPGLKQWIMIQDVKFMDNKIFMRTSKSLTGPWSDEILIYEIPEVTPGKKGYNPSNFAYLARECIQYYDKKKKSMLITYDVNNSKFSDIVSDPTIYIPKVVNISLKDFFPRNK